MGFKQRDFIRVRLVEGCERGSDLHRQEEDGRFGMIVFHEAHPDHPFAVLWRTPDNQGCNPIGKDVLGFYNADELVRAQPMA